MEKKPQKSSAWLNLCFSLLWVGAFAAIGVSLAFNRQTEPTFSQDENRVLQGLPKLTFTSMLHGDFSGQFENYLLDNFFLRNQFTRWSGDIQSLMNLASFKESVLAINEQKDTLEADITTLPPIDNDTLPTQPPQQEHTIQNSGESTEPGASPTLPTDTSLAAVPISTNTAPSSTPKPTYPSTVSLRYTSGSQNTVLLSYKAKNVEYAANIINSYAACLKPGGRLCYIMVPSSYVVNKFIFNKSATNLTSNIEDCLRANVVSNVEIFSIADILSGPIQRGEYVYFHTDRHWTPLGCHYVYEAMAEKMGMKPIPYSSYTITQEYPFLGTLYRDNPSASMKRNPDSLDIVQPYGDAIFYEMDSHGNLNEAPILDMHAPANDRHAIYLGNSQAAWSVIKTKANTGRKAIVIRDSFGLIFSPYLIPHYDEIDIVNPMYFNKKEAGGNVRDLMMKYGIDDCYIIIGDVHSYNNDFLINTMRNMLVR